MLLRMFAAMLVLGLAAAPPAPACGHGRPGSAACIARDMLRGPLDTVEVGERYVSWRVPGDPRTRVESLRLSDEELTTLFHRSPGSLVVKRRPRAHGTPWVTLAPFAAALAMFAWMLVRLRRRAGVTVRVLTRNVERREAFALAYVTALVAALVWGTWPNERAVTLEQFRAGLNLGLVNEVTFAPDALSFHHAGSRATFVVSEPLPPDLRMRIANQIIHTPNPGRPYETLHHIRVHHESESARRLAQVLPWAGALVFWTLWVHLIRRQSWW